MKNFLYNSGFFFKEAKKILHMNWLSNIFSLLSTSLVLFILGMVVCCWTVSSRMVEMLQKEAQINAYFDGDTGSSEAMELVKAVKNINGVRDARLVDKTEAYGRMEKVLGKDSHILELFDENPFEAFIEVRIHLDNLDIVLDKVEKVEGIEYVRDNRDVLERIQGIAECSSLLGYLTAAAAGITTLVVISHIIRQGIYNNREQINTLRLLGAPDSFIGFPFVLAGLILTLGGGIVAAAPVIFLIYLAYGQVNSPLPFIPLPPREELIVNVLTLVLPVSILLGILGSLFGLSSIKNEGNRHSSF